jgi:tetratricopeptide (TPR) repeat protein
VTNDDAAETCRGCGTPLESYARVASHAANLFNQGLAAASERRLKEARDLFAAVVLWCPNDSEARNAYALACFQQGDKAEARRGWEAVLARSSRDELAARGMLLLDRPKRPPGSSSKSPKKKAAAKRR